jgi:hypothetical protein
VQPIKLAKVERASAPRSGMHCMLLAACIAGWDALLAGMRGWMLDACGTLRGCAAVLAASARLLAPPSVRQEPFMAAPETRRC